MHLNHRPKSIRSLSIPLPVLLRFGRLRLLALSSFLQFLSSVFLMFGSAEWMDRLVEVVTGVAVGIHVPVHQVSVILLFLSYVLFIIYPSCTISLFSVTNDPQVWLI